MNAGRIMVQLVDRDLWVTLWLDRDSALILGAALHRAARGPEEHRETVKLPGMTASVRSFNDGPLEERAGL